MGLGRNVSAGGGMLIKMSMGVGGGVHSKGGINPVGLTRFGALKGMEATNEGYDRHYSAVESMQNRAKADAKKIGDALEEKQEQCGLTGKMSEGLLSFDKWIRGLD